MATCMLCASQVGDAVVCPYCGGAVDELDTGPRPSDDPTRLEGAPWSAAPTAGTGTPWDRPSAEDPTRVAGASGPSSMPWLGGGTEAAGWQPAPPPPGPFGEQPPAPPAGYGPAPLGPPSYAAPTYGAPGYGPPAYGVPYGGGWAPVHAAPTSGLATGAFVTSLISLVLATFCLGVTLVGSPVGAVLGHVALRRIKTSGEGGRGLAIAGVVLGWIGTAFLALGGLFLVAVIAGA